MRAELRSKPKVMDEDDSRCERPIFAPWSCGTRQAFSRNTTDRGMGAIGEARFRGKGTRGPRWSALRITGRCRFLSWHLCFRTGVTRHGK